MSPQYVLLREELTDVGEGLELKRIASGVKEEHRCLFPDFALKADVRLDDELNLRGAKSLCQRLPVLHREHDAKVWNRDVMAIDGVVMWLVALGTGLQMSDDLMAEEVEVDPLLGAAALRTAKRPAVERARSIEIVNGKCDVERGKWHRSSP